ncbi:MAG: adenylate/guanylate cyclase domain-containing protein [Spirochaetia bacterium]
MRGIILIVDNYDYSPYEGDLATLAMGEGFDEFAIAYASDVDQALEIFFDQPPALVVANVKTVGGSEALMTLKAEEMYRHVPVVVVVDGYNPEVYRRAYSVGADAVLTYKEVEQGHLILRVRPLLVTSALFQIKIRRSSELEEKNLQDFILLDLIRPYVSRSIWQTARQYAEQQKIQIGARESELAVAFGDIKSFTTTSEKMNPAQVIEFLNVAFEVVTRHIYEHGGDVDKFIGDAFFAVFEDPRAAIKSMAAIQQEIADKGEENSPMPGVRIQFRIAVHSGKVIRGNVGGNERFDNTLIGDAVNTCSRLEHEAPIGGLLVSNEAADRAGLVIPEEKMQLFTLRGRDGETRAFSFFDMIEQGYINRQEWL